MASWTLTSHLLSLNKDQLIRATQSPFLAQAASGNLPKSTISNWLANDRLYMQGYISLAGELLRRLRLPTVPTPSKSDGPIEVRLLDWLVDALVNIRREEKFFMDVAERYGLDVDISQHDGGVQKEKKIEGLTKFEKLFESLTFSTSQEPTLLPWLEGVVLFWATEKVYFEAWSWAKRQAEGAAENKYETDEDGGAMRKEFIPNWTNEEFIKFVNTLEVILNEGVQNKIGKNKQQNGEVVTRAERVWKELLDAEEAFWPKVGT